MHMVLASLILSVAFICSMCILFIASKGDEKSSSNTIEYKQPDIHIHNNNNSHGGNSSSVSHGSTSNSNSDSNGYGGDSKSGSYCDSKSDSVSRNNNSNTKTTITNEDNVSEDMVKQELNALRNELMRKQQLDMEIMEQLNKLDELMNK